MIVENGAHEKQNWPFRALADIQAISVFYWPICLTSAMAEPEKSPDEVIAALRELYTIRYDFSRDKSTGWERLCRPLSVLKTADIVDFITITER